jgi:putative membrane protein
MSKDKALLIVGLLSLAALLVGGASASPRAGAPRASAQDANYLQTSISGDRFEIIGGKLAEAKGSTAQVRALGARLIKDHSKSLAEAVAEAHSLGVKVPEAPTPSMVWELNTVRSMTGSEFDRSYSSLEVKDHEQDIEETTFEVAHGGNAAVKHSAGKELPMLRMHLMLSHRALGSV